MRNPALEEMLATRSNGTVSIGQVIRPLLVAIASPTGFDGKQQELLQISDDAQEQSSNRLRLEIETGKLHAKSKAAK